ncbi:hypothetical protein ACFWXK_01550 [Streptomyces sp. NPDC059070]|uniref:hypothetical protein n=1 Tax=Streptomyces sp. NPDC059070 TaxID=3346713 RepID=UPI0036B49E34
MLYLIVSVLFSIIVALVAGMIFRSTGASLGQTILYAGGALGGTFIICLAVLNLLL